VVGRSIGNRLICNRGTWIAVAAVGVVLYAPAISFASCGNHVRIAGQTSTPPPKSPLTAVHSENRLPSLPDLLCSGPHCSRAPTQLPFVPGTVSTQAIERWAESGAASTIASQQKFERLEADSIAASIHRTFPPEPPPRFAQI
jgi:hypothetical protein